MSKITKPPPRRSPSERRPKTAVRALPLAALLAMLVGIGLLVAFRFYRLSVGRWPDSVELLFVTAASFLLIWGLTELIGTFFSRSSGRRRGAASSTPRLGVSSWVGIVLVSLGAGGLSFVSWGSWLAALPIALLLVGLGCLVSGGKRFVTRLLRGEAAAVESQSVALTAAGGVCLCMAIVFLLGAYIGPSNMLMLMFAFTAGPFIVNGWFAFRMNRQLGITRSGPPQVVAGEPVSITVTLSNRKRLMSSWLMVVSDPIQRESERGPSQSLTAEVRFPRIPRREAREASYRVRLMQRGRYRFGPIRVRTRFPLGLVERSRVIAAPAEMLVGPRLGRLTDRWRGEVTSADELVQRQRPRRGVFPDEFEKLRGFRYGDNPRLIHWRTSARQNSLMVREYQEIRDRDLMVLLDLSRPDDSEEAALDIELAVSFAASLCIDQLRRSRHSQLAIAVVGEEFTQWRGVAHPSSADPLLAKLALVEAARRPPLEPLWEFARNYRTATMSGLFLTTRPTEEIARPRESSWVRTLGISEETLAPYFQLS